MHKDYSVKKNADGSETRTTVISGPGMRIICKVTDYPEYESDDFEDVVEKYFKRIYKVPECNKEKEAEEDIFDRIQIKKVEKTPKSASKAKESDKDEELASKIADLLGDDTFTKEDYRVSLDAMTAVLDEYDKEEIEKLGNNLFKLLSDKIVVKKIFDVLVKANRKIEG